MILASKSPRRQEILSKMGYEFEIVIPEIDESFPADMPFLRIPEYLAEKKVRAISDQYANDIMIGADTIVVLEDKVINKPADEAEAFEMLSRLSGKEHTVISGVCVMKGSDMISFTDVSKVKFLELTEDEILYYIEHYKPFDKAGAYGVQDFIGMIGIESITGSFYNVMGLPIHKVYRAIEMLRQV